MNVTEGLSGQGGLDGVRWLLSGRSARHVLRRELAALLEHAETLGPCRLQRAKFKPGRKLTAYYELQLRNGGSHQRRPVAVSWTAARTGDGVSDRAIAALQADAEHRGLAAPFRALETGYPAWGMRILVSPLDERFPQLGRLSDSSYVAELLSGPVAVTPIRYRPGQRHVLRYDLGLSESVYAKLYEGDEGRDSSEVAIRIGDWLSAKCDGVAAAAPFDYLRDDRAVLYRQVAGRPLSELVRRGHPDSGGHFRRAGSLLRALHAAPAAVAEGLPRHDLPAEARATARAAEHVEALLPATGAKIHELLERARAAYERLPGEAPAFTHGDFKADHLWAAEGRLTLIDFDTCRVADPASDLGKLLADQHWWCRADDLKRAQQHFIDGYGAGAARLARARVFEAMLLVKIAARRVRLFDPSWQVCTEALVDRAEAVLNNAERGSA